MTNIIYNLFAILGIGLSLWIAIFVGTRLRRLLENRYLASNPQKPQEEIQKHINKFAYRIIIAVAIITLVTIGYSWLRENNKSNFSEKSDVSVEGATSSKIDMHEHFRAGGNINFYLAAMQAAHIEKMVLIPTDWPPSSPKYKENLAEALAIKKQYPNKFIVFATAWNKDPEAATIIEKAIQSGAEGIKFIDWLSSTKYPDDAGPVDSPNMYKVYRVAEKYGVPILMHIDYQKRPEWKVEFERVAKDFPKITFILAHYCRAASEKTTKLELCAETLDKFPNVYTDISMGGGLNRYISYFDKNPKEFSDFIIKYQDRILWGADIILDGEKLSSGEEKNASWIFKRMLTDFYILELEFYGKPLYPEEDQIYRGLHLPKEVLKKIYWENPRKVLNI